MIPGYINRRLCWIARVLAEAPYRLTAEEIFYAINERHADIDDWSSEQFALTESIRTACRAGHVIARARRTGGSIETVSPEEWGFLDVALSGCDRWRPEEPCETPFRACWRHRPPGWPTGELHRRDGDLKTPAWDLASYQLAEAQKCADVPEQRSRAGHSPGLRETVANLMQQLGRPGRGGPRLKIFADRVRADCGVKTEEPGYGDRTIRRVVASLAHPQKSPRNSEA